MKYLILAVAVFATACTPSQQQTAKTVGSIALNVAQAACARAADAKALALGNLKGGAANTVTQVASIVDATCQVDALVNAVAKDPATGAFIDGLGAALVASTALAKP